MVTDYKIIIAGKSNQTNAKIRDVVKKIMTYEVDISIFITLSSIENKINEGNISVVIMDAAFVDIFDEDRLKVSEVLKDMPVVIVTNGKDENKLDVHLNQLARLDITDPSSYILLRICLENCFMKKTVATQTDYYVDVISQEAQIGIMTYDIVSGSITGNKIFSESMVGKEKESLSTIEDISSMFRRNDWELFRGAVKDYSSKPDKRFGFNALLLTVNKKQNWFKVIVVVGETINGKTQKLIFGFIPVDEYMKRLVELEATAERLTLAAESLRLGLWDWDTKNAKLVANSHFLNMLQLKNEGIRPVQWRTLVYIEDIQKIEDVISELSPTIPGPQTYRVDYRIKFKDGRIRWINETGKIVMWEGDNIPARIIGTIQDITEQKNAEFDKLEIISTQKNMVEQQEIKARQLSQLNKMVEISSVSTEVTEAYRIIVNSLQKLYPKSSGMLLLLSNDKSTFDESTRWGTKLLSVNTISADQCWGLRQGKIHLYTGDEDLNLECPHVGDHALTGLSYLCVPIITLGQISGLIVIEGSFLKDDPESWINLTNLVSNNISLTLTNIQQSKNLKDQSIIDSLTGLYNRRYLITQLERELRRAIRSRTQLSLVMIDIDLFKEINDNYGHHAGDLVLIKIASFMKAKFRNEDIVSRLGGDEFVIVLPNSDAEKVKTRLEDLNNLVHSHEFTVDGKTFNISISMGMTIEIADGITVDEFLQSADKALYKSKREGRNRLTVFTKMDN